MVQQWHRYAVAQALLDRYKMEGNDFLGRIVAMDETCARSYEPSLKRELKNGFIPILLVQRNCTLHKVMFIVAYGIDGVILHHAVPPRQTINAVYYCTFLQHHLHPTLRRKRRHLMVLNPIILHDNVRSHSAASVTDLLRRWQWKILEHPPYPPDMSPCDYDLFAKVVVVVGLGFTTLLTS